MMARQPLPAAHLQEQWNISQTSTSPSSSLTLPLKRKMKVGEGDENTTLP